MLKKVFKYKGYSPEELNAMSMDEFVKLMPSRIKRTLQRGFTNEQKKLMNVVKQARESVEKGEKGVVRTHCRDIPILPQMVGLEFEVYNGKEFNKIEIQPEMIGQYMGEYSLTRKPVRHSAPGVGATRSSLFVPIK